MEDNASDAIKRAVNMAHIEGISFLLLLFVAMPLKYMMDMPLAVTIMGSIHGLFFIALLWHLYNLYSLKIWSIKKCAFALFLGVVPAGTFFLK